MTAKASRIQAQEDTQGHHQLTSHEVITEMQQGKAVLGLQREQRGRQNTRQIVNLNGMCNYSAMKVYSVLPHTRIVSGRGENTSV